jgi:hypothetical protein
MLGGEEGKEVLYTFVRRAELQVVVDVCLSVSLSELLYYIISYASWQIESE